MSKCQVSGCPNKPDKNRECPRIYFYRLGSIRKKNPNRFAEFLAMLRPRFNSKLVDNLAICSVHFTDDSYEPGELSRVANSTKQNIMPPRAPRLKADAWPTLQMWTEETRVRGCKYKKQTKAKTNNVHPKNNERKKKRDETQTSSQIYQSTEVDQRNLPQVTPKNSTTKRKRVESPLFCDIDSNTLYPEELQGPKKSRFDAVCRICASHATEFNELIDIFDQSKKNLDFAAKINKFLPIDVQESDSLPHWICFYCADLLVKMDNLYFTCQKMDAYFNEQRNELGSPEAALVVEYDDEDTKNVSIYNPDLSSPTCDLHTEIKIEDTSIVGLTAEEEEYINLKTPDNTNCSEKNKFDFEIYAKEEIEPNRRKMRQQSFADSSSASDNKGIEEPNVPDFTPEVVDDDGKTVISTSLTPKKFPWKCEFCDTILRNRTSATSHYELQHTKHLCTNCFVHYQTHDELVKHNEEKCSGPTNNGQENSKYRCKFCCNCFGNKTTLKEHVDGTHSLDVKSLKNKHQTSVHTKIYSKRSKLYECGVCDKSYTQKIMLMNHMSEAHKRYVCYVCLKCFNDEKSYTGHLEIENHDLKCKICGAQFSRKEDFKRHQFVKHNIQEPRRSFTCLVCSLVHNNLTFMKKHYYNVHDKFYCSPCNLIFDSHSNIDTHCLQVHSCNTSWSYQCSTCKKYFESENNLTFHIKIIHENYNECNHLCDHCGKSLRSKKNLREHVVRFHENVTLKREVKIPCKVCKKMVQSFRMKQHLLRHAGIKEITCSDCNKKFVTSFELKKHIDRIHNIRPDLLECDHCHTKLEKPKMEKHIEEEHITEWYYICNYCKIYCKTESEIWQHCITKHVLTQKDTNPEPFLRTSPHQCETCLIYLANSFKLKVHRYVAHSDSTHYKTKKGYVKQMMSCKLCGETFGKNQEENHMYKVHKVPRKFACDSCDRSFHTEVLRTKHVAKFHRADRTVICSICHFGCKTKKDLSIHKWRMHSQKQEFSCPHCEKKFKSNVSLKIHVKMHSADMPFKCESCDLGFHRKRDYTIHMSRHENNLKIYQPKKRRVEIVVPSAIV